MGAPCLIADGFQGLLSLSWVQPEQSKRENSGNSAGRGGTPGILAHPQCPGLSGHPMDGAAQDEPHIWLLLQWGGLSAAQAISVLNHDQ